VVPYNVLLVFMSLGYGEHCAGWQWVKSKCPRVTPSFQFLNTEKEANGVFSFNIH
jgi:hypothetical protein